MKYIKLFEDYHNDNHTSSSHTEINHAKPDATHQHHVIRAGTHEDRDSRDIVPNTVSHHFKTEQEARKFQDDNAVIGGYLNHENYMKNGNLHPVDSETGHKTHNNINEDYTEHGKIWRSETDEKPLGHSLQEDSEFQNLIKAGIKYAMNKYKKDANDIWDALKSTII